MQDFIAFVIKHWELWLAFVIVLGFWLRLEFQEREGGNAISVQKLIEFINRYQAVVLDIRTKTQFDKSHILGAQSYPEKILLEQPEKIKRYQKKRVIIVDDNGILALKVVKLLLQKGFSDVVYLKNGMQAWTEAKMPLQSSLEKLK